MITYGYDPEDEEEVFDYIVDMIFRCRNLMYFYDIPKEAVIKEVYQQVKEGRVLFGQERM